MSIADIHETAIIAEGARLGKGVKIGPWCQIGPHVTLNDDVELKSNVVIDGFTTIGNRTKIHSFSVIGGPPQHMGYDGEDTRLIIGEDNDIREYVTINTGTVQGRHETRLGSHCLLMASTHIAHDCIVGDHVIMANNATLGGHVVVNDFVFMGGLSAVHQYCRIGIYSFVGAAALVTTDVIPYGSVIGNHARLEGLNIVGMKRRGTPRAVIHDIRAAYRLLFAKEGTLQERIADVEGLFPDHAEIQTILEFMKADSSRSLCTPRT
ncbi:MAG: acyl-ACP--UDP-N-acetylglucosamine O-acyltransferase [bacterium]